MSFSGISVRHPEHPEFPNVDKPLLGESLGYGIKNAIQSEICIIQGDVLMIGNKQRFFTWLVRLAVWMAFWFSMVKK